MTTPSLIFTANPGFSDLAVQEVRRALPDARLQRLVPGVYVVGSATSFFSLAEQWRQAPPIFIRHICPVQVTAALRRKPGDVHLIKDVIQAELAEFIEPALSFSVQTRLLSKTTYRPYAVSSVVSDNLTHLTGAALNVRAPQQVVSVIIHDATVFIGLSLAVQNLSNWAGGEQRFARQKGQVSRAEFKLLEALSVFAVPLPPRGVALDLGAAPGGWTRVLRQKDQYVTAVDPAPLHPAVISDKKVRYLAQTAEMYLQADPDQFDLIVNDMHLDARDSARLTTAYAPNLYAHGAVIMSCELPEKNRETVVDHTLNILRGVYKIAGARQLFHNRSEFTVYLKKR